MSGINAYVVHAGLAGLSLAAAALQHKAAAPVKHLRNPNPYVTTALGDWQKHHGIKAMLPRQKAAAPASGDEGCLAGTSSMGMSGVNAHALLSCPGRLERIETSILVSGDQAEEEHSFSRSWSPAWSTSLRTQNSFTPLPASPGWI